MEFLCFFWIWLYTIFASILWVCILFILMSLIIVYVGFDTLCFFFFIIFISFFISFALIILTIRNIFDALFNCSDSTKIYTHIWWNTFFHATLFTFIHKLPEICIFLIIIKTFYTLFQQRWYSSC